MTSKDSFILIWPDLENFKTISTYDAAIKPLIKKSTQEKFTTVKDKDFDDVNQVTSKDSFILIGLNF